MRVERLTAAGIELLMGAGMGVDYVAIVDGETLRPLEMLEPGARLLVAAEIDGVRLIDNAPAEPGRR
jgi:pantoate--beta-alanine ligase